MVGGTFRVEDVFANLHTFHLPDVGTAPFDDGCKTKEQLLKEVDGLGKAAHDDLDAEECSALKGLLSRAAHDDKTSKEDFRKLLEDTRSEVTKSCDLSEFEPPVVNKPKQ